MPGRTIACLVTLVLSTVMLPATALSLRALVDAMSVGTTELIVVCSVLAALACAFSLALDDASDAILRTSGDRLGRLDLHPEIHRSISEIQGMEHLERSDYLDRVAIVRGGTSPLAGNLWATATALSNVLKVALTTAILGTVNPILILLSVVAFVPGLCDNLGQRVVQRVELSTAEGFRLQQHLFDTLTSPTSLKDVQMSGAAHRLLDMEQLTWTKVMRARVRAQWTATLWSSAGWLIFVGSFVAALYLLAFQAAVGKGTAGDLVLAIVVSATLQQAVAAAVRSVGVTFEASRVIGPYFWLRRRRELDLADRTAQEPFPVDRLGEGLEMKDVSFTYAGSSTPAVSNFSVSVSPGTIVAIVGEYGSGKSTIIKLLAKFYEPTSGHILVEGRDLRTVDTDHWRHRLSAAFQDFGRFHTTLAESVGLGDVGRIGDAAAVSAALRAAGAEAFVESLQSGVDTQLGVELGGTDLSEGQWQRVALARASMSEMPLLLLLDEPTASIDAPSEEEIYRRFMRLSRERARTSGAITFLVSHRFSTVTEADLILVMDRGTIVEQGTHHELMALRGRYADMYQIQVDAYATTAEPKE